MLAVTVDCGIYLTQADFDALFGSQASDDLSITLRNDKTGKECVVSAHLPCVDQTQARLAFTDCRAIGLQAPIRSPSDVSEIECSLSLHGPEGSVGCAYAFRTWRYASVSSQVAARENVQNHDLVALRVNSPMNSIILSDILVVISSELDEDTCHVHLDYDEAGACMLQDAESLDLYKQDHTGTRGDLIASQTITLHPQPRLNRRFLEQESRVGAVRHKEIPMISPRSLELESPLPIDVNTSNRHVHLSKADLASLFGEDYKLTPKKALRYVHIHIHHQNKIMEQISRKHRH